MSRVIWVRNEPLPHLWAAKVKMFILFLYGFLSFDSRKRFLFSDREPLEMKNAQQEIICFSFKDDSNLFNFLLTFEQFPPISSFKRATWKLFVAKFRLQIIFSFNSPAAVKRFYFHLMRRKWCCFNRADNFKKPMKIFLWLDATIINHFSNAVKRNFEARANRTCANCGTRSCETTFCRVQCPIRISFFLLLCRKWKKTFCWKHQGKRLRRTRK